jgi:hypothetical protein
MKTTNKILSLACATALFASPVFADNTDTATVTVNGEVIANLEITEATGTVTMPDITRGLTGETVPATVSMVCSASGVITSVTYSTGASPFAHGDTSSTIIEAASVNKTGGAGQTGACALFNITGQSGYSYLVDDSTTVTQPTDTDITFTPACLPTGGVIGTDDTIGCGADLSVAADATAATYTGTFDLVVTYD